jgi:hypothetical protein
MHQSQKAKASYQKVRKVSIADFDPACVVFSTAVDKTVKGSSTAYKIIPLSYRYRDGAVDKLIFHFTDLESVRGVSVFTDEKTGKVSYEISYMVKDEEVMLRDKMEQFHQLAAQYVYDNRFSLGKGAKIQKLEHAGFSIRPVIKDYLDKATNKLKARYMSLKLGKYDFDKTVFSFKDGVPIPQEKFIGFSIRFEADHMIEHLYVGDQFSFIGKTKSVIIHDFNKSNGDTTLGAEVEEYMAQDGAEEEVAAMNEKLRSLMQESSSAGGGSAAGGKDDTNPTFRLTDQSPVQATSVTSLSSIIGGSGSQSAVPFPQSAVPFPQSAVPFPQGLPIGPGQH